MGDFAVGHVHGYEPGDLGPPWGKALPPFREPLFLLSPLGSPFCAVVHFSFPFASTRRIMDRGRRFESVTPTSTMIVMKPRGKLAALSTGSLAGTSSLNA